MLCALSLLLATAPDFRFPAEPIVAELARGEKIYYQKRGIERTLMEDRVAVGKWFTGTVRKDTNQVIWLSPAMVSRWLGYLNAKEKWSKAEMNERWNLMLAALDGKLTFVVELYALPKQSDYFEVTESAATKPETALDIRFLSTYLTDQVRDDSQHIESIVGQKRRQSPLEREEPRVSPFAVFRAYSLDDVQRWPWYSLDPVFDPLNTEFSKRRPTAYDGVVGDYVRAVYVVQASLPEKPIVWNQIELRAFAPGKEMIASFVVDRAAKKK